MKKLTVFLLLISFSVSIAHAYMFEDLKHESVHEFVAEFNQNPNHGDLCDVHFAFHIPFVLNDAHITLKAEKLKTIPQTTKHPNPKILYFELLKPPIA